MVKSPMLTLALQSRSILVYSLQVGGTISFLPGFSLRTALEPDEGLANN